MTGSAISVSGINNRYNRIQVDGVSASDPEEAALKSAMFAASARHAVAVLNERFDDSASFLFGALSEIDHLVLEHDAPAASIALLRQHHPALDITMTTKAAA